MVDDVLHIVINGIHVADLIKHANQPLTLVYAPTWLNHPRRRSLSLSLPLQSRQLEGSTVKAFFENLLPDNPVTVARIVREFHLSSSDAFTVLKAIGRDCIGAIQLFPNGVTSPNPETVSTKALSDQEFEEILKSIDSRPFGMTENDDFRLSLAGAQTKTGLLYQNNQWFLPLAATPTSHILKLALGSLINNSVNFADSCENEWLCLQIAKGFGFDVANAKLITFGTTKTIAIERFDRAFVNNKIFRLPTEDFCQALGVTPTMKYESDGGPGIAAIMNCLNGSQKAAHDRRTFMAAQVLLWLLDSPDGHAKNYSIFIDVNDGYYLTPLYDILSVAPLIASGQLNKRKVKLAMSLIGKNRHYRMEDIQPRHFLSTAEAVNFPIDIMRDILEKMANEADDVIDRVQSTLPPSFPRSTSEPIFNTVRQRAAKIRAFLQA